MTPEELEAVKEVLLRHLHGTNNLELQAALWQLMDYSDELEARVRWALQALVAPTK